MKKITLKLEKTISKKDGQIQLLPYFNFFWDFSDNTDKYWCIAFGWICIDFQFWYNLEENLQ